MRKLYWILFVMAMLLAGLSGCSGNHDTLQEISDDLNIDVSDGAIVTDKDTHGGFHGDGISITVIEFSDNQIEEMMESKKSWHAFPPNETVQAILYGYQVEDAVYGPFLADEGKALLPEIENGYYWLKDRQVDSEKSTGADIIYRESFNFTIAVYDSDARRLYYCKLDT